MIYSRATLAQIVLKDFEELQQERHVTMDSDTCTELMLTDASCENLDSCRFKMLFFAVLVQNYVLLKKIFGQQHGGI